MNGLPPKLAIRSTLLDGTALSFAFDVSYNNSFTYQIMSLACVENSCMQTFN